MQYRHTNEFLVHFIDKNNNQNSDLCRSLDAGGMLWADYESAKRHGEHVLTAGPAGLAGTGEIIDYRIYQLTF